MEAPKRIYLQTGLNKWDSEDVAWESLEGVSWCWHRIEDSDVEYVRADMVANYYDLSKVCLVTPTLVPIRLLILLHGVGLERVGQVHAAIRAGTLQSYKGIGPKTEQRILAMYTEEQAR